MDYREKQERDNLLRQLESMGYNQSGRKTRSDKGKARGDINYPAHRQESALAVYLRIKARMYKRDAQLAAEGEIGTFLEMDENSFYGIIPERYRVVGQSYQQDYQGRAINHTVKKVKIQKEVDLEEYRFAAYKEQAVKNPQVAVPIKYWPEIRQMLNIRYGMSGDEATQALTRRQITWSQLFCEFYFLSENEYWLWDYEHWRRDYSYVPAQQLQEDFVFSIANPPGSQAFHPEWAYKQTEKQQELEETIRAEQERKARQFIINLKTRKGDK